MFSQIARFHSFLCIRNIPHFLYPSIYYIPVPLGKHILAIINEDAVSFRMYTLTYLFPLAKYSGAQWLDCRVVLFLMFEKLHTVSIVFTCCNGARGSVSPHY